MEQPDDDKRFLFSWLRDNERTLVALSLVILCAFIGVSAWVLHHNSPMSAETKGSVVTTWNNLAVAVGAFWFQAVIRRKD